MITKDIKETIKRFFFVNPNSKLRVREIEKKLKLSLPSVIRYCKELQKEEILTTIKTGNVVFYTADKTNSNFILQKKFYNLNSMYESGLIEFLKKELSNPPVLVFGSYSRGEDIETSDIDLYIETSSNKIIDLHDFEKELKRNIQVFKHKSVREIKNVNLANNILNGVILNNYLEVFK
ncbi:MAG TPA: nucleotidyltransferase domain-containing protein [Candidatus Pacearchaeota archaeon]|nr:nucleotidyltransferase domain-containing protein [Candidatus Pacearchaeota archaeon]